MPVIEIPEHKRRFLQWLDRFARVNPGFRKTMTQYTFTEEELIRIKPQIEAKYRLKAEFRDKLRRGA